MNLIPSDAWRTDARSHVGDPMMQSGIAERRSIDSNLENASRMTAIDGMFTFGTTEDRDALYGRLRPWMQRLISRYLVTPESREDAEGELYCKFRTLLDKYEPARNIPVEPYLYRQLGAFIFSHARSGWRLRKRESLFFSESGAEDIGTDYDPTTDWNDRLVSDDLTRILVRAIQDIPLQQKRVITMRYCQDLSYEEIAARLKIKISTARSIARVGLHSLRKWMHINKVTCE